MSNLIEAAQLRLELRRRDLGIQPGSLDARSWAEKRMDAFRSTHPELVKRERKLARRGRRVRCVACGVETRVETNRHRRLRTLACVEKNGDENCGGRLRPLSWFRGAPDAV